MTDAPSRPAGEGARLERLAPALVAALMLAFFAQGYFSAERKSLTWDEPTTLGGGYAVLAWGDYDVYLESPPLMQVLSSWSLWRSAPVEPAEATWREALNPKVQLGLELAFNGGRDLRTVTRNARLPVLLFGTGLVGLVFLWGRVLFGVPAALAATTLAAFSPNLIAHGRLATADMGVTVLMFAAVASFWWAVRRRGFEWWALCGVATGLALTAKFTALVLGPIYVALVLGLWWIRPETRSARWVATAALPIALLCWLVIAFAYGFDFDLSLYREGVARIYSDHSPDHYNYLLGEARQAPFWHYNLVAYALKTPTASLILLVVATVAVVGRVQSADRGAGERTELAEKLLFLLVPAAAVIGVSFIDDANIGLRRILPAFPFLIVFAAYAIHAARGKARAAAWSLVALAAVESAAIYPDYLAFFNLVAGGPTSAPFLLDDSNIDWGQDLPALARWQATRSPDELLSIRYFGTAYGPAYGIVGVGFDEADIVNPRPGVYTISVQHLVGFRKLAAAGRPSRDWLTEFEPSDRLGYSIYIYEFE